MTLGFLFYPAPVMPRGLQGGVIFPLQRYFWWREFKMRGRSRLVKKPGRKGFAAMRAMDVRRFGLLHARFQALHYNS
jgi:hypothetical protein